MVFRLFIVACFFLVACQNRPCREIQAEKMAQKNNQQSNQKIIDVSSGTPQATEGPTAAGQLRVKVFKPDGSLQCGMGGKIPLETMEKDLKGIKVFSRTNINDGLMRIQVCGAPTGQSNVYEISKADLEKALKLGFKQWAQD